MRVILSTPVCGIPQAVTLRKCKSTLEYAEQHNVDLRTAVELDVQSQDSADAAIAQIIARDGRLDVVVHNAGHMVYTGQLKRSCRNNSHNSMTSTFLELQRGKPRSPAAVA